MLKRLRPWALALLSGLLLSLSFPRTNLYLLAWIALVPLFFAIQKQSLPKAFLVGWLTGLIYFLGTLSWVTISMRQYGGLPWSISTLIMLLLVAYLALYVGFFSFFLRYLSVNGEKDLLLLAPTLWVSLEFLKGHLLTGFPWASLAYSQSEFLSMIQIADIGSIYAVGFVMVLFNRMLYLVLRGYLRHHPIVWKNVLIGLSVLGLSLFYGLFRLSQAPGEKKTVSVAVIQGNIPQDQKWDRSFQKETIARYKRLSLSTLNKKTSFQEQPFSSPSLLVWPEAATPFIYEAEPGYQKDFIALAQKGGFDLLFGAPATKTRASGEIQLLNSAYLLSVESGLLTRYDKMHLVPFGEYVPFSKVLFFINKIVEGIGAYVPGEKPLLMTSGETKIGAVICFEVIFPDLVRRFVKQGATIMTTLTNDAWFGDSAAPYQHFSMVVFRAIENRVPFARAANTGISGFIDANGRVIEKTALFVEATASAALSPGNRISLYTRFGDFFPWLCATISLLFGALTFIKRRKNNALRASRTTDIDSA